MLGIKTQPGVLAPKPAKNPPDPTQPNNPNVTEVAYTSESQNTVLQHQRMGYIGENALEALRANTVGVSAAENIDQLVQNCKNCPICIQAKVTKKVSRQKPQDAKEYLKKVHSDIYSPIKP